MAVHAPALEGSLPGLPTAGGTGARATSAQPVGRAGARLRSLDVLRGVAAMGMVLVNSMAHLKYGEGVTVFAPLLHARWAGLTLADLVFPAFVVMVGLAIPFSLREVKARGLSGPVLKRILGRTARLFLVGLVLVNLDAGTGPWLFWDVLQRIALVFAGASLLFLACRPRTLAILAAAILVLYWPLTLAPSLDDTPTDVWQRGHTFVSSVDRVTLGEHREVKGPEGYDPEGLLSTLPALAQALLGVLAGEALSRRRGRTIAAPLALAGGSLLALGLAWSTVFPVVKDLWSSSFVLVTTGLTFLALAGLHWWLDGPRRVPLLEVPIAFGLNAIAAYVLHRLTIGVLGWQAVLSLIDQIAEVLGEPGAALLVAGLYLFALWLPIEALRRRGRVITV